LFCPTSPEVDVPSEVDVPLVPVDADVPVSEVEVVVVSDEGVLSLPVSEVEVVVVSGEGVLLLPVSEVEVVVVVVVVSSEARAEVGVVGAVPFAVPFAEYLFLKKFTS
jgi:hypothetical protein